MCIAESHEEAYEDMVRFLGARGLDLSTMDPEMRDQILALVIWGDPDEVGETLSEVAASGVDGFTCSLPGNGFTPGRVELLGRTASKVLG